MADFKKENDKLVETVQFLHSRAILENEMLMLKGRDSQLHKEIDELQLKLDKCDELDIKS